VGRTLPTDGVRSRSHTPWVGNSYTAMSLGRGNNSRSHDIDNLVPVIRLL
jgi:hypothetical protein